MKKILPLSIVAVICVICCLFFIETSKAQKMIINEPLALTDLNESFTKLITIAREKGTVPVIVGFSYDFKPEGYLTDFLKENQRLEIKNNQNLLLQKLQIFEPKNVKQYQTTPYLAMTIDAKTLEFLQIQPEITFIREDQLLFPMLSESTVVVHAPQAWTAGYSGQGQVVAILDTGVDKNHSFLSGKVVSEACYSTTSATTSSLCPGGVSASTAANSGLNCSTSISGCSHGTHVAGIAAGRAATGGVQGVAKDANIIAVQVFSRVTANNATTSFFSDSKLGLQRVLQLKQGGMNVASVNMSLGTQNVFTSNCDTQFADVKADIDNLRSVGVATVIASGNGDANGNGYINAISSPACISSSISVGSTGQFSTTENNISFYSNHASFLSLLAPGYNIFSSVPGGSFDTMSGTSQATPHVAGAWAILKQRSPSATVTQVLTALSTTGQPIADTRPPNTGLVKPRILIDAALQALPVSCGGSTAITIGQTVNGNLQSGDCLYTDNSLYDAYTFSAAAGQQVYMTLNSTQFNAYLLLYQGSYPGGTLLTQNDDGGGGTNARIPATSGFFTIPATGTYTILANSLSAGQTGSYTLFLGTNITPSSRKPFDFDGDGKADISVFRPSNSTWYVQNSSNSSFTIRQFGLSSDRPAPADFDNDGKTDIAIFRPSNGLWYWINSATGTVGGNQFGTNGDMPVPGDYDGDGKADITIFRPSTGTWWIYRSSNNGVSATAFGSNGDRPTPGDFDGDSRADLAVFRPSNASWYRLNSSTGAFIVVNFGASADKPVPADYSGDGKTDIGVYRPSTGAWYWINSATGAVTGNTFGISEDRPSPGDYDGDGRADLAVFRPSQGTWYLLRTTAGLGVISFGLSGDIPTPNSFVQ